MEALAKIAIEEAKAMQTQMTELQDSGIFNSAIQSVQKKISDAMQKEDGKESSRFQPSQD
jgi:hypothetical protein